MTVEFNEMFRFMKWKDFMQYNKDGALWWRYDWRGIRTAGLTDLELYNLFLESNDK